MLIEVLQIDGTVVLDIMFFNKKLQQACQFESQGEQGEHLQHQFDTVDTNSLLKSAFLDKFRPGSKLEIARVQNILAHKVFNCDIDLPILPAEERNTILKNQEKLYQLIIPIQTDNLKHMKMAVRMTSTVREQLMHKSRLQFYKYTFDEISPSIMKNLEKFQNLSKQFSRFQENLAQNADASMVNDRTLE